MNILFLGSTDLGWKCCQRVLEDGHLVSGIISIPETFRISWAEEPVTNVNYRNFEDLASGHDIPLMSVGNGMKGGDVFGFCQAAKPDLIVVAGWYYMIPLKIRNLARLGTVGIHASLLPKYRGGAPLIWAVINGDRQAGTTLFHLVDGMDEGNIVAQETFPILEADDISNVLARAEEASLRAITNGLSAFRAGDSAGTQQQHENATYVNQRKPEDGLIRWDRLDAENIYNWVRAQTRPYPGAFSYLNGDLIRIWRVSPCDRPSSEGWEAGDIVEGKVCCADGRFVFLEQVQIDDDGPEISGEDLQSRYPMITSMDATLRETDKC